jgi:diguanylate cyclase (GGDEF)-like protein/PAS domain S-box-containing protein
MQRGSGDVERSLADLVELVPDAMVVLDDDHRVVTVNTAACAMFGWDRVDLAGKLLDVLLPAGVAGRHRDQVEEFAAGGAAVRAMSERRTLRARRRDGDEFPIEITIAKTWFGGRQLFSALVRDVTVARRDELMRLVSARRVDALMEHASDGIAILDGHGRISYASPFTEHRLGAAPGSLIGVAAAELVHPNDLAANARSVKRALSAPGASTRCELRLHDGERGWVWTETTLTNLTDNPYVDGIVANFRDITDRKKTDRQREGVARLGLEALRGDTFDELARTATGLLVELLDADSAAVSEQTDEDLDAVVIRSCTGWSDSIIGQSMPAPPASPTGRTLASGTPVRVDDYTTEAPYPGKHLIDEAGIRSSIGVVIAGQDLPWGVLGALSNRPAAFSAADADFLQAVANVLASAIERTDAAEELSRQALHDPLTGVANRALLTDRIEHALQRLRRAPGTDLVVTFVDIDHFKQINDQYGHNIGDELLCAVARRLQAVARAEDTVARFGGDEFVVVTCQPHHDNDPTTVVKRLHRALREPFTIHDQELWITASVGAVVSSHPTDTADSLVRDADTAMYEAKTHGRDRYEIFDKALRAQLLNRIATEHDLRAAIARGELQTFFQPIIDSTTEQVVSFEALTRWDHPRRGLISPDEFIPIAEDTGLIVPMGQSTIRTACEQLARLQHDLNRPGLTVSVNLSPCQLTDPELIPTIHIAITTTGIKPEQLRLEITETVLVEDFAQAARMLQVIADLGVGLIIDDFGTGYSSLTHLQQLPISCIKLDRSFVTNIANNPTDRAIVAATIALANELHITTIAEGIETTEQLDAVRKLGCTLIQGYHYTPALPHGEIEAWIHQHSR